jgi:hypothetical protein
MSNEKINNLHCSPYNQIKYGEKDGTCYSLKDLRAIANEYNKLTNTEKINVKKPKQELHEELEKAFQSICKDELCWVNNDLIKNHQLKTAVKNSFRPLKPREWYYDKKTWLNTYDILFVMEQYEKLYKNFKFMGVFPIDFQEKDESDYCIGDDLCNFHISYLSESKKKTIWNYNKFR